MWKKIAETSLSQIVIIGLALVNSIIINRTLGPAGKGEYAYILLIAMTAAMILEAGFTTGLSYKIGKRHNSDINKWKSFSIIVMTIWTLLCFVAIGFSLYLNKTQLFIIVPIIFLFQISMRYLTGIFIGEGKIRTYNILQIGLPLFQLICLVVIIITKVTLTPLIAAEIYAGSIFINVAIGIMLIVPFKIVFPKGREIIDMIKYSLLVYITNLLSFLNYRIDMFIIKIFLPYEYLGLYSVGVFFIEKAKLFSTSSSLVNFSFKVNIMERGNSLRNIRIINTVNTVVALIILSLGYPLIWLFYSSDYLYAYWPMLILAPAIIANGMGKIMASELSADGILRYQFIAGVISIIINIIFNFILIPHINIIGAAIASLISYSVNMIIIAIGFNQINKVHWKNSILMNKDDLKIVMRKIRERE